MSPRAFKRRTRSPLFVKPLPILPSSIKVAPGIPRGDPPPNTTTRSPGASFTPSPKVNIEATDTSSSPRCHPPISTASSPIFIISTNSSSRLLRTPSPLASPAKPDGGSARISTIFTFISFGSLIGGSLLGSSGKTEGESSDVSCSCRGGSSTNRESVTRSGGSSTNRESVARSGGSSTNRESAGGRTSRPSLLSSAGRVATYATLPDRSVTSKPLISMLPSCSTLPEKIISNSKIAPSPGKIGDAPLRSARTTPCPSLSLA